VSFEFGSGCLALGGGIEVLAALEGSVYGSGPISRVNLSESYNCVEELWDLSFLFTEEVNEILNENFFLP